MLNSSVALIWMKKKKKKMNVIILANKLPKDT